MVVALRCETIILLRCTSPLVAHRDISTAMQNLVAIGGIADTE